MANQANDPNPKNWPALGLGDIGGMPTVIVDDRPNGHRIHESCLRSWHIVNKVLELLRLGTPDPVIIEIIEHLRAYQEEELSIQSCTIPKEG